MDKQLGTEMMRSRDRDQVKGGETRSIEQAPCFPCCCFPCGGGREGSTFKRTLPELDARQGKLKQIYKFPMSGIALLADHLKFYVVLYSGKYGA